MIIEIEAHDTLFFRDGKPFTMGEDVWANGNFPPSPSVIYGALRAIYFGNNTKELSKANTKDDPTNNLNIKSIYFKFDNNSYLPAPLDIVKTKDKNDEFCFLNLKENDSKFISSIKTKYILSSDKNVENIENGLISINSFNQDFIKGERSNSTSKYFKKLSEFVELEPKTGIGRNKDTLTTREGNIYRVAMMRIKKLKIVVDFENLEIPDNGIIRLGGEGKTASYRSIESKIIIDADKIQIRENLIFCLYLSTPAIFKNGCLPDWIDPSTLEVNKSDFDIEFLTVMMGKTQFIGGFDIVNNKPKPMKKAVSSGTVYYFQAKSQSDFKKFLDKFHGKSISEELSEQGFGISYIGVIK